MQTVIAVHQHAITHGTVTDMEQCNAMTTRPLMNSLGSKTKYKEYNNDK